ncbi:tyrosine-type recombinase/integrase [Saccharopolyspora sp. ASAGF58]|uniref:tyrosine-type recombinase/integrase n=1 Tax=Saccharopolyspora sp. ASAGF58 TaxID=2719023 RepID=UPI001446CBC5|nr:tyrosine-type recombinase/integrase [Saccharopolyspora sp. ASAGF58]
MTWGRRTRQPRSGACWRKTIKAKNLSANTERGYLYTAQRWAEWLAEQQLDIEPDRVKPHHVDDFIADIIEATSAANGAHHYRNLRVFFGWLVKRDEMSSNPMDKTEPPNVAEKITPLLSDEEHRAVFAVCGGRDFAARRDTAIILLFIDTGIRVSEMASLRKDDIDLKTRQFQLRGKGGKVRIVGFGNSTGLALARYLKEREKHSHAASPALWLSSRRDLALKTDGIKNMLNRRGKQAGVSGSLHAHRFRHDFSHRWQDAGGSEHGLMLIAGWSSNKMARHYGKQAAARRALKEQARLGIADSIA